MNMTIYINNIINEEISNNYYLNGTYVYNIIEYIH